MKPRPTFQEGETVRKRDAPDVVGRVVNKRWNPQLGCWAYRVQFGVGVREIPEDALELLPSTRDPWDDLEAGRFASAVTFRTMMTFERLRKPPSRIASSFGSAKATFYPFQFKPVLKFLENPLQRLLIADDVGLGKTIEAGYILRELRARGQVERVLIVVPSRLREKWRSELRRRFDEPFELVMARDVLRYLENVRKGRSPEPFLWIASLESLRQEETIKRIRGYSPQIDLVVFDEAHRLRNRTTLQYQLGEALSQVADAMLFLTATPVQTSQENLFTLLHLLDSETFVDSEVFMKQLRAQRPVLKALRAIRTSPPNRTYALEQLRIVAGQPAYETIAKSDFFGAILERLDRIESLDRRQRVDLERDLGELCFTSGFISRTRKSDVVIDRPRRTPQSVLLKLTPEEREIYDQVENLCARIDPSASGWGHSMSVLMAYRYTASCIPAALGYFRHRLDQAASIGALGRQDIEEETEYFEDFEERPTGWLRRAGDEDSSVEALEREIRRLELRIRDGHVVVPTIDTKYTKLKQLLYGLWEDDRKERRTPRKVVVFSFFKRTLRYLERSLKGAGIGCVRIDGSIPIADREAAIEEFATDPEVRILLSSEVGGEGLDLQFASVLVNYDLPWNPMVLEQRIGRLDRIGQKSDRILIFNFSIKDTVEERILLRLYERIGIFEETIGEIDPILGREIEKITLEALRGKLTPREQEELADRNADAMVREQREAKRLTEEADALLAADQAFLDEVESLIGQRRVPDAEELASFLRSFVEKRYPGSRIGPGIATRVETIQLVPQLATDLENQLGATSDTTRVATMLRQGKFKATFNSAAISEHARAEIFHARHPLIRFAVEVLEKEQEWNHRCFALCVPGRDEERAIAFSVALVELTGIRPYTDLVTVAYDCRRGVLLDPETGLKYLIWALECARSCDPPPRVPAGEASEWREILQRGMDEYVADVLNRERSLNAARATRRKATIEQTLQGRLAAAEKRLSNLRKTGAAPFAIRMAEGRVARARKNLQAFDMESREAAEVGHEVVPVAVGVMYLTR